MSEGSFFCEIKRENTMNELEQLAGTGNGKVSATLQPRSVMILTT